MSTKRYETRDVAKMPHYRREIRVDRLGTIAAMLFLLLLTPGVRGQSALDGFDPNVAGASGIAVNAMVVQPDGKILIGGSFSSTVGGQVRNRIARINPDGTLDTAFNPNADDVVRSIALQSDGKILVAGNFSNIGGQPRNRIARLDAATGLADSFDPNATGNNVAALVVQADGKILVGGLFSSIGGQPRNNIARLNATTGLADSFDPNASGGSVGTIVLQPDGKILVGGLFSTIGGQTRGRMARLDATTGLADSFNPNPDVFVSIIALQADGKILVGGGFTNIGGQARQYIARLDPSTGLADSFNPSPDSNPFTFGVYSIAVQPDGKILAGGPFSSIGGQPRNRIARLDATTGLADSFNPSATGAMFMDPVNVIVVQADGKVLLGGGFTSLSPNGGPAFARNRIARVETDGRLDRTLDLSMVGGQVKAIAVQPDGKILIGGAFSSVLGVARNRIARLNTDGTLDTAFNPDSDGTVDTIALQADGKILAGGFFTTIGGQPRNRIARLDPTTGLPDSFDPNANNVVRSIAVQADGKILVGGLFGGVNSIGGQTRNRIARLDPATGMADSFNPNSSPSIEVIAVQADGKILVGGSFANIGGQPRNRIARLDPVTGLADSFNPSADSQINTITIQEDGKILVGGFFANIGGQPRNRLARVDATTGLADSFDPNANAFIESISVQADGKILTCGQFSGANSIGGQTRNHIARLDATTGLADSFDPNANDVVTSIAVLADGKILAGGFFANIGGQPRSLFARLSNDTAALQNLAVTAGSITWTRGGSSPQFARVTFEYSTDNVTYAFFGNGTASGGAWTLAGLNLPTGLNFYIRARGYYRSGYHNSSGSSTESVRNVFLPGPITTPTPTPPTTPSPTPTPATPTPTPTPSATPPATPTPTPTATPTPTPAATPTTLGNISTRLRVETGDNVLIGGFIVTGTQPKKIIVRAIGPSLPLAGALADPVLELRNSSGALIRSNNDWRDDPIQESEINATGIPPSNDLEAAIVETLPANGSAYTAIVRGANNGTGIGVVEAYDLDRTVNSKLANISTRGFVQTGDDVLIGGLIVLGQNPLRVIVRAIGPSLPFPGVLANPTLNLHDGNGTLLISNNDWRDDPAQESEIIATGIPPSNDLESAIVRDLTPGSYTAIVRGVNDTTGIAVVEAYGLN